MLNLIDLIREFFDQGGDTPVENELAAQDFAGAIYLEERGADFNAALADPTFYARTLYACNVVFETECDGGLVSIPEGVTLDTVIAETPLLSPYRSYIRFIALHSIESGSFNGKRKPSDY